MSVSVVSPASGTLACEPGTDVVLMLFAQVPIEIRVGQCCSTEPAEASRSDHIFFGKCLDRRIDAIPRVFSVGQHIRD